jgi:hypothetical protein
MLRHGMARRNDTIIGRIKRTPCLSPLDKIKTVSGYKQERDARNDRHRAKGPRQVRMTTDAKALNNRLN